MQEKLDNINIPKIKLIQKFPEKRILEFHLESGRSKSELQQREVNMMSCSTRKQTIQNLVVAELVNE